MNPFIILVENTNIVLFFRHQSIYTMRTLFPLFAICFFLTGMLPASAQKIELLTSGTHSSFRGLSVVSDKIVWVSGSNGTVGKSLDGGKNWEWITVPDYTKRDFRD